MTAVAASPRAAVEAEVRQQLLALHADASEAADISFRSWVPDSARRQRRRLFMASVVDGAPRLVAKVALAPDDDMLRHEWASLARLGTLRVGELFPHPAPVSPLVGGFVMTHLLAEDFADTFVRADAAARGHLLKAGAETILALQGVRPAAGDADPAEIGGRYADTADLDARTQRALSVATVGPTHGDLGPWNFRTDASGSRVGVLDWEDYRDVGLPALDVLNLVVTAALLWYPEYRERGFEWLFDQAFRTDSAYRAAMTNAVASYAIGSRRHTGEVFDLLPFFCRWMVTRIERQGRSAAHMFYRPFAEAYLGERPDWIDAC